MTEKDDFSPVQDSGEFERSGGLLGRWRRRVSLPAVELGTERFLVGGACPAAVQATGQVGDADAEVET